MASFVGAIAIADLVKTTLGPKGMDKILQSVRGCRSTPTNRSIWCSGGWPRTTHPRPNNPPTLPMQVSSPDGAVTVTNDGATILKAVHIDNPAAKVLVDIAKTQARAFVMHARAGW